MRPMRDNITGSRALTFIPSFDSKLVLWAALWGAVLSKTDLMFRVSIGDLLLSVVVLVYAKNAVADRGLLSLPREYLFFLLFSVWTLLSALYLVHFSLFQFSTGAFARSYSKLNYYILCSALLMALVARIRQSVAGSTVENILFLNALLGFYIYAAMQTDIGLPYRFFWTGLEASGVSGYFRGTEFVKMRGVFSEPSVFGIFQNFGLAYLFFVSGRTILSQRKIYAVLASVLLTFSLSAYFMLLAVLTLYVAGRVTGISRMVRTGSLVFLAIAAIALLFYMTPLGGFFAEAIVDRIFLIFSGRDISAIARIFASWEMPWMIIKESPFFGAGLGNMKVIFPQIAHELVFSGMLAEAPEGWNILAYIFGSTGTVGVLLFIALILRICKKNRTAGAVFFVSFFATGTFLEPPFWVFLAILFAPLFQNGNFVAAPAGQASACPSD